MTTQTNPIIEYFPSEIEEFEAGVNRFQAGDWDPTDFMAFRLRQGVYGQRQPDVYMFRIKFPFGGMTADQLDMVGEIVTNYAPLNKGHVTTRENIQLHHIPLDDAAQIMRMLASAGLTTREACGNTVRNVTGCEIAGVCALEPFDVTPYAAAYSRYFVRHPFTQSMPRKIKTAFSGCSRDCAITGIHDVGFLPVIKGDQKGFKMVMGGGTSIMPRIAPTLYEFVSADEYLKITEAALRVFHNSDEERRNRMKARVKFLIARIGIDEFRDLLEEQLQEDWAQRSFDPSGLLFVDDEESDAPALNGNFASTVSDPDFDRWLTTNVKAQKQSGYHTVTAKLPLGDIQAEQFHQLADLTRKYGASRARLTHQQNLAVRWVPENALYEVWQQLSEIGFGDAGALEITDVVSCPGTDSCKLGITSSMGLARAITDATQVIDKEEDPLVRQMHIKMSGCPNGCGQHHVADIGFHGAAAKGPGGQVPAYEMFLGGGFENGDTRIGLRVKTKVPAKSVPNALRKVLDFYKAERGEDEIFRDFAARVGPDSFEPLLAEFKDIPELNRESLDLYIDWDKTAKYILERGEGECAV
jgi:sulfite reductase beta subunit-like hemoprotein